MPDFTNCFVESKGKPISYEGKTLLGFDRFPVKDGEKLKICIESTNNSRPQGLVIDITGSCEINGQIHKKGKGIRVVFWEDAELIDPKNIQMTVFTKTGNVVVYNIWEKINKYLAGTPDNPTEKESKSIEYWSGGAAMIVEEIENGRRYRCNDGLPDENFDDIVFTVQRIV